MTDERPKAHARWWLTRPARLLRAASFRLIVAHLVRRYARPLQVLGIESLERLSGPVIFASHHESHSDTPIVLAALPPRFRDRLTIAAAADVLFTNPLVGASAALFLGAVPVERQASALASVREIVELLAGGNSLLIYPLGKCSHDGSVGEFKPGVGLLARLADVPVVLVGIEGSRNVLPLTRRWPRRSPVWVRFGAPKTFAHTSEEAFVKELQLEMEKLLEALRHGPGGE